MNNIFEQLKLVDNSNNLLEITNNKIKTFISNNPSFFFYFYEYNEKAALTYLPYIIISANIQKKSILHSFLNDVLKIIPIEKMKYSFEDLKLVNHFFSNTSLVKKILNNLNKHKSINEINKDFSYDFILDLLQKDFLPLNSLSSSYLNKSLQDSFLYLSLHNIFNPYKKHIKTFENKKFLNYLNIDTLYDKHLDIFSNNIKSQLNLSINSFIELPNNLKTIHNFIDNNFSSKIIYSTEIFSLNTKDFDNVFKNEKQKILKNTYLSNIKDNDNTHLTHNNLEDISNDSLFNSKMISYMSIVYSRNLMMTQSIFSKEEPKKFPLFIYKNFYESINDVDLSIFYNNTISQTYKDKNNHAIDVLFSLVTIGRFDVIDKLLLDKRINSKHINLMVNTMFEKTMEKEKTTRFALSSSATEYVTSLIDNFFNHIDVIFTKHPYLLKNMSFTEHTQEIDIYPLTFKPFEYINFCNKYKEYFTHQPVVLNRSFQNKYQAFVNTYDFFIQNIDLFSDKKLYNKCSSMDIEQQYQDLSPLSTDFFFNHENLNILNSEIKNSNSINTKFDLIKFSLDFLKKHNLDKAINILTILHYDIVPIFEIHSVIADNFKKLVSENIYQEITEPIKKLKNIQEKGILFDETDKETHFKSYISSLIREEEIKNMIVKKDDIKKNKI